MVLKKHNSQTDTINSAERFGFLQNGDEVFAYTLSNDCGMNFQVITYGATISSLIIPLPSGNLDVVLGFDNADSYEKSFHLPSAPFFGAAVGRYAGRINNSGFILNGKTIQLSKNHGKHHLHGGNSNFSNVLWKVKNINSGENPSITLQYISRENDENYPGELTSEVTYTLTENNELQVSFTAKSSEDTIINLTQHSYFNLDGHSEEVTNQQILIPSAEILETNSENIPTGKMVNLDRHKFDFRSEKQVPSVIDNTFVNNENASAKATLFSRKNNLKMLVFTNQPAVHVYVGGNCFGQLKGKENSDYHPSSGICFETQNFPDAPNHPNFPDSVLRKGEIYSHHTTFKFENS